MQFPIFPSSSLHLPRPCGLAVGEGTRSQRRPNKLHPFSVSFTHVRRHRRLPRPPAVRAPRLADAVVVAAVSFRVGRAAAAAVALRLVALAAAPLPRPPPPFFAGAGAFAMPLLASSAACLAVPCLVAAALRFVACTCATAFTAPGAGVPIALSAEKRASSVCGACCCCGAFCALLASGDVTVRAAGPPCRFGAALVAVRGAIPGRG